MSSEPSQAVLRRSIRSLIETASTLEETASHLLQATGPSNDALHGDMAPQPVAAMPDLTPSQRRVCERVINVFETGSMQGRYDAISIFADGPHDIRQITYGRSQTAEYGNLRELVRMYAEADGQLSAELSRFVPLIGRTALVDDGSFKDLLRRAGGDPVMRETQDVFFDRRYFQPALLWARDNGFARALSVLVIYDSFIHSGSILDFLRARFAEVPPARGGDEQTWVREYVTVRHDWLLRHHRPPVRASAYRTRDLGREIARGNWDLGMSPLMANGTPVDDRDMAVNAFAAAPGADDIPFLGDLQMTDAGQAMDTVDDAPDQLWGDGTYAAPDLTVAASPARAASTPAARVLEDRRISLATAHVSGVQDQATARQNIMDAAAGRPAQRSSYGNAPGGSVMLDDRLLQGLLALAERHSFAVSEIAGGSHNANSRHYQGVSADFNIVDGRRVSAGHPGIAGFKALCRQLGATEVRGPGDPHHDTHLHAAWPRVA